MDTPVSYDSRFKLMFPVIGPLARIGLTALWLNRLKGNGSKRFHHGPHFAN